MSIEKDILNAAAKIVSDFGAHQKQEYFSNFAEDATFLFYTHPVRLESRAEYEKLWDQWESEDSFKVHSCNSSNQLVQDIDGHVAVFTHDVKTVVELGGEVSEVLERETIVFSKQNSKWLAVHEHLSPST
jgi:ketosteroid isomerase-like protein